MNVALHGMEEAAGVRYWEGGTLRAVPGTPVLVRYADLCRARHKSAYAERQIMPTVMADAVASWLLAGPGSA
jgi:RNA-directed DNA polymerase